MHGGWTRVRHIANAETPIIKLGGKEKAFSIMYLLPGLSLHQDGLGQSFSDWGKGYSKLSDAIFTSS